MMKENSNVRIVERINAHVHTVLHKQRVFIYKQQQQIFLDQ